MVFAEPKPLAGPVAALPCTQELQPFLWGEHASEGRELAQRSGPLGARFPEFVMVPAHDARAAAALPTFPASRR
jgi:hypothetical protein